MKKKELITHFESKYITLECLQIISFILFLICFVYICLFFGFTAFSADDNYFSIQNISFDWITKRYQTWSSRVIIESVLIFLVQHEFLFKLLNIAIFISLPFALKRLLSSNCSNKKQIPLVYFALVATLIPFYELISAGYGATVTNYLYPICAVIWIFSLLKHSVSSSLYQVILLLILSIYACNHEQTVIIVLCYTFPLLFIYKTTSRIYSYMVFTIALISLFSAIMCPGNAIRVALETKNWLPEFSSFSFFDKVYIGITTSLYHLTYFNNFPFLFCFSCIILAFFNSIKSILIFLILNSIYRIPIRTIFKSIDLNEDASWINQFPIVNFILLFLLVALMLLFVLKIKVDIKSKKYVISFIILAFALRSVLGFSPTVFASSIRPDIVCQILFIFAGIYVLARSNLKSKYVYLFIFCSSCYNYYKFLYFIPFNL